MTPVGVTAMRQAHRCDCYDRNSNQAASQSMGDRFKTVVGSQLLVDVMEVITQSLWADSKRLGDPGSVVSCREHA